ncbi:MAG: ectoine synthase [Actinomycetota bacterium]
MIIKHHATTEAVKWGNGTSHRLLIEKDGVGYSVTDTVIWAGTSSNLQYRNHLESCYCISGRGWVVDGDGIRHRIEPGTLYALDEYDAHTLIADPDQDLRLICMFYPALQGDERHRLADPGHSAY